MSTTAPYGTWASPITAELVTRSAAALGEVRVDPATGDVWWSESRPEQAGRITLVRRGPDGATIEVLADPWSARTRVHEYGGGAWWVHDGTVWFASWADQRVHRLDPGSDTPVPVTPEPPVAHGWRYADGVVTPDGRWVVCVRESHCDPDGSALDEAVNEIVAFRADGSTEPVVLVAGTDFVAAPRLDASGSQLAWLVWDHPRMPWDGTELWTARVIWDATLPHLDVPVFRAGGADESLVQPEWTPDGDLLVVSDRDEWWNVYRVVGVGELEPLAPIEAEVATPPWVFGQSRYVRLPDGRLVMAVTSAGRDRLVLAAPDGTIAELDTPFTSLASLRRVADDAVVAIAASSDAEPAVVRIGLGTGLDEPPVVETLRAPRDLGLDPSWFSTPEPISFPTTQGRHAHGLYYPPTNPDHEAPADDRPPLLVFIHGGPTSGARPMLQLSIQYWTSRGFAVVDVNYGGSTGYGRTFRRQLDGQWGVVDVDDCVAAAQHLVDTGRADPERLLIRGGSAGGFTTLAALAGRDTFAAGASLYGVADLMALARDTHKFESRYLDRLIGPLPQAADTYRDRSPIHHLDGFDRPLIVFQGLEDEIVPPNQAEAIVAALESRGVPVAYVPFEGEQHGFRRAENIRRVLEAELWFYGHVLGFEPADEIEPVEVRAGG